MSSATGIAAALASACTDNNKSFANGIEEVGGAESRAARDDTRVGGGAPEARSEPGCGWRRFVFEGEAQGL